ncbi:hypothetical protein MTYM_02315 [Methylococcales bacterium]|nr:hypothetical protein MTYM_02315 [Methylococcales bacterium]
MSKEPNGRAPLERQVRLEPCPFCGVEDAMICDVESAVWVRCQTCGCAGPDVETEAFPDYDASGNNGSAMATAYCVDLWNKRA